MTITDILITDILCSGRYPSALPGAASSMVLAVTALRELPAWLGDGAPAAAPGTGCAAAAGAHGAALLRIYPVLGE